MTATRAQEVAAGGVPVFSERLEDVVESILNGEAPNVGRFCGHCYTPLGPERRACPHCETLVEERAPVEQIPEQVFLMFRQMLRRESLVVNSFAYLGLLLAVFIFIVVFYFIYFANASIWWFIFDIVLLFVLARVLAGLLGGFFGDELGFRYARRKLAEDWRAYEAER